MRDRSPWRGHPRRSRALRQRKARLPRRRAAPRRRPRCGATVDKVRCTTLSGRSLRTLRIGGALTALAAGEGLVATARRGCSAVQLWHAESGTLLATLSAHADGSTIRYLSMRGGLLLSTATDGTAAIHSTHAAAAALAAAALPAALASVVAAAMTAAAKDSGQPSSPAAAAAAAAAAAQPMMMLDGLRRPLLLAAMVTKAAAAACLPRA